MAGKFPELPLPLSQGDAETDPTPGLEQIIPALFCRAVPSPPTLPKGRILAQPCNPSRGKQRLLRKESRLWWEMVLLAGDVLRDFPGMPLSLFPQSTELLLGLLWDLGHPHLQWELEYRG